MRLNCHDVRWWLLVMVLVIFAPAAISGCVETPTSHPVTARQYLIGKPESAVLACAGPPRSALMRDGVRVLTYVKEAGPLETSFAGTKGSRPEEIRHVCTAILMLQDDRVTEVRYRMTPESSVTHEHCEEIFQRCGP